MSLSLSVSSLDVVINQRSVILEAKLGIVANRRFNGIFAVIFFLWVTEISQIRMLQKLSRCWPFFRVKLKHTDNQFYGLMRGTSFEPFIERFLLSLTHLLNHCAGIVSNQGFNLGPARLSGER
jgi:hypothetical protein